MPIYDCSGYVVMIRKNDGDFEPVTIQTVKEIQETIEPERYRMKADDMAHDFNFSFTIKHRSLRIMRRMVCRAISHEYRANRLKIRHKERERRRRLKLCAPLRF